MADKSKQKELASNGKPDERNVTEECFVIMPLSDPDGYESGHFKQVFEDLFAPACESAGYRAIRADEVRQTNLIHLDVLQKIIESPMALCDLSSRNPNVLFELGLRQAFDKPVVLVQEVGTPPIFDIHPLRYTNYHKDMLYRDVVSDQTAIRTAIVATKEDIGNEKSINSIVKLLSLTHPASLTQISETEKDSAVLQVLMSEISSLRSEIRSSAGHTKELALATRRPFHDNYTARLTFINEFGLENYLLVYGVPVRWLRKAIREANDPRDLYNRLLNAPNVSELDRGCGLGPMNTAELEEALQKAKLNLTSKQETPEATANNKRS